MSKTMPKNNSFYIAPLVSDTIAMGGDPNMKSVVTRTRSPMHKQPSLSPKRSPVNKAYQSPSHI